MKVVGVTLDHKVETPIPCYSGLPDVSCFIELLGVQTRMTLVVDQEFSLLVERFLYLHRRITVLLQKGEGRRGASFAHGAITFLLVFLPFLRSDSIISSAVSNGP